MEINWVLDFFNPSSNFVNSDSIVESAAFTSGITISSSLKSNTFPIDTPSEAPIPVNLLISFLLYI